jgi:hypothetical protein
MLVKFNPQGNLFHKRYTHKHIAGIETILDNNKPLFWLDTMDEYLETSLSGKWYLNSKPLTVLSLYQGELILTPNSNCLVISVVA